MPANKQHPFTRADVQRRGIIVGIVVGTILNCINQGPEVMSGASIHWGKVWLTFLVPYCVSTYSSVSVMIQSEKEASSEK